MKIYKIKKELIKNGLKIISSLQVPEDLIISEIHRQYVLWKFDAKDYCKKNNLYKNKDLDFLYIDNIPLLVQGEEYLSINSQKSQDLLDKIYEATKDTINNLENIFYAEDLDNND